MCSCTFNKNNIVCHSLLHPLVCPLVACDCLKCQNERRKSYQNICLFAVHDWLSALCLFVCVSINWFENINIFLNNNGYTLNSIYTQREKKIRNLHFLNEILTHSKTHTHSMWFYFNFELDRSDFSFILKISSSS